MDLLKSLTAAAVMLLMAYFISRWVEDSANEKAESKAAAKSQPASATTRMVYLGEHD